MISGSSDSGAVLFDVGCGAEELGDELELARETLQVASLAVVLHQQPQQARCRHDQHHDDAPRC